MNKIIQRIANTIVANLANTEAIGLFNGKIGVCLFLYKYSQYSGCKIYENIASELLDDILSQLRPELSPSALDGVAGVGYALTVLLREGFLESSPDDDVFHYIDEALLSDVRTSLMKELHAPVSLCSSGIYLLSRISFRLDEVENVWITGVIENTRLIIRTSIQNKDSLKLSLLNSMLYVFCGLYNKLEINKIGIEKILRDLLNISEQTLSEHKYQDIDIILFKQNLMRLPLLFEREGMQLLKSVESLVSFSDMDSMNFWYDNLWWDILYDLSVFENISLVNLETYINEKIQEAFYDDMIVNSKLSAIGLWLMKKEV
ncbi:hypothetical protein [Bacteroides sp.]|uniref:hypothetical protein n=1 Tax=Bacteroides sp. TaxID=29523 RepID=UPI002610421A|nr:hypothetical protein [Bacteroides sp.]MDD3038230.1 hypothetical protein [Bacteroides sp.]